MSLNRRWCSDGFEIGCDNVSGCGSPFALDCVSRGMSFLATHAWGPRLEALRDLMGAVRRASLRVGQSAGRFPIEGCPTMSVCRRETRSFARDSVPRTENDANHLSQQHNRSTPFLVPSLSYWSSFSVRRPMSRANSWRVSPFDISIFGTATRF